VTRAYHATIATAVRALLASPSSCGSLRLRELTQVDLARGCDWLRPLRPSLQRGVIGAGRGVARRHAQD
jgi:hypothetical protein